MRFTRRTVVALVVVGVVLALIGAIHAARWRTADAARTRTYANATTRTVHYEDGSWALYIKGINQPIQTGCDAGALCELDRQ